MQLVKTELWSILPAKQAESLLNVKANQEKEYEIKVWYNRD